MPDTHGSPYPGAAFADLIRKARTKAGLTQQQLAVQAGMAPGSVNRWENGGAVTPKPTQVRSVCAVLRINPTDALVALGYLTAADLAQAA